MHQGDFNMEDKIKFSILIPTKDRLELLKEAVSSVLNQSYNCWELVISDNCSSDDIEEYIVSLHDERIVYYRQPEPVSVTDNWNTANDMASGEYMIMLGDDDALLPNALEELAKRILDEYPQVICFMVYQYLQPNVDPDNSFGDVDLATPFSLVNFAEAQILTGEWRKKVIEECFMFERGIGYNMQFYCYSKEIVKILNKYGRFYEPPYPDYYTTSMCMLLAETFVYIPKILVIIGITPKSYGYYYRNNIEKEGMKFHKDENYRLHAPVSVWNKLCSVDEMDTAAFVTFTRVSEKIKVIHSSLIGYYKSVIKREIQYCNINELYDLIYNEMKQNINDKEYAELLKYAQECKKNSLFNGEYNEEKLCFSTVSELLNNLLMVEKTVKARYDRRYPDISAWINEISLDRLRSYIGGRNLWIWGAYDRSVFLAQKMQWEGFYVEGYIDKTYEEKAYMGKRVFRIEDVIESDAYIMIPLIHRYDDITGILNQYGYEPNKDFVYFAYGSRKENDE